MMKVSIVTVCFNAANEIASTLSSICRQTHGDIELIIVDGGSTDDTLNIIDQYRSRITTVISERDEGIYHAMNKGIIASTGDLVIFMNAGDWFVSEHTVSTAVIYFQLNPSADVIFGGLEVRFTDGKRADYLVPESEIPIEFLVKGSLPHQATFSRRHVFGMTNLFNQRYSVHADYDWYLKAAADSRVTVHRVPFIIASFGLGGRSSQLVHERERHHIQNTFPMFQRPEWLRRRIEIYQQFSIELKS